MKKIFAILCALSLILALAACGGSTTTTPDPGQKTNSTENAAPETEAPAPDTVVGVYKLTNMVSNSEEDADTDFMAMLEAFGVTYYMTIEEGGAGNMDIMGEKTTVNWTDAELTLVDEESGDSESMPYAYADGVLTVKMEEGTMTFEKLVGDELEDYLVNGAKTPEWLSSDDGEIPEGEPSTGPVSGTIEGCDVTILGAEATEDDDGEPVMRIFYEFTNGTDEITTAFSEIYYDAVQDGAKLESAYVYDNAIPEDEYEDVDLLPGATIRATRLINYDPEGGTIGVRFSDLYDDDVILYYIDPSDPIDAPEEPFVFETDDAIPAFLAKLDTENGMISILSYEFTTDWSGAPLLRVYYDYTNTGDEAQSCFMDTTVYAFQDGYGLENGYADDSVDEDSNRYEDVEPGETISCAAVFEIRSSSPIIFVVKIDDTGELLSAVVEDVELDISGLYHLYSIMGYSIEEYAELADVTVSEAEEMLMVLIQPDGTAVWTNDGEEFDLKWTLAGTELTLFSEEDDESLVGVVSGTMLYLDIEEIEVVLVKSVG